MNKAILLCRVRVFHMSVSMGFLQCPRCASQQAKQSSTSSYYEVLGVTDTATEAEIKAAFYEKSKIHHPDSQPDTKDDAEFLLIRDAYETLKKKNSRQEYDSFLRAQRNVHKNFHHPLNHPIHSKDFVKWRARHVGLYVPKGWKYSHEEQKETVDLMSIVYFAIFCGIISYIVVSEKVRRGKIVSYNANNFAMHEYRQQILRNRKQSAEAGDNGIVNGAESTETPSQFQEDPTNVFKTWK